MNKKRLFNSLSLIINLSIIYFTIDATLYNFRSDIIRNELVYGFDGIKSYCFFTVLSNTFLALSCIVSLVYNIKNAVKDEYIFPKKVFALKFVATVSVTVTMMTVILFLAPYAQISGTGYFSLFTANNFYLHFLSPLLAVITFIFFEKTEEFDFKNTYSGLIPTALYSMVYITMVAIIGEANGGWIDFYGLTFGGHLWLTPISAIAMLGATYLFSFSLYKLNKKFNKI